MNTRYFGNGRSLSIEGCNRQYIDEDHEEPSEFHSQLSDDSRQDASTTHTHMISMLNELQKCKKLKPKCTIWESTDGCCKQYRCGASLYFLSLLSSNFNITVDGMIPVRWLTSKIAARICLTATVASSSAKLVLKSKYSAIVETRSAEEKMESISKPLNVPKNRSVNIAFRYGG